MRRALITGFASLLAVALIAPAAQAATQVRHYEALLAQYTNPGNPPTGINGRLGLEVIFKNKQGSPNKFTPRQITVVDLERVVLTCINPPAVQQALLTTTMQTAIKLHVTPPHGDRPKANRYSFSYQSPFPTPSGTSGVSGSFGGRFYKAQGKGPVLANGTFTIGHLDFDGGPANCASMGPRDW